MVSDADLRTQFTTSSRRKYHGGNSSSLPLVETIGPFPPGFTTQVTGCVARTRRRDANMTMTELPESVRQAWGAEIAEEFKSWLAEQLELPRPEQGIQISAAVARQKVNAVVLERVSNLLLADEPELARSAEGIWVWHVPVHLTFPGHGRVGQVGALDVDTRYGEVRYTADLLADMQANAERLTKEILTEADD